MAVSGIPNPRGYPDEIRSAETGRLLRRRVAMLTVNVGGHAFEYGQPGWWASLDDPEDHDGQLIDQDNVVRAAARREARAKSEAHCERGETDATV